MPLKYCVRRWNQLLVAAFWYAFKSCALVSGTDVHMIIKGIITSVCSETSCICVLQMFWRRMHRIFVGTRHVRLGERSEITRKRYVHLACFPPPLAYCRCCAFPRRGVSAVDAGSTCVCIDMRFLAPASQSLYGITDSNCSNVLGATAMLQNRGSRISKFRKKPLVGWCEDCFLAIKLSAKFKM